LLRQCSCSYRSASAGRRWPPLAPWRLASASSTLSGQASRRGAGLAKWRGRIKDIIAASLHCLSQKKSQLRISFIFTGSPKPVLGKIKQGKSAILVVSFLNAPYQKHYLP